MDTRDLCIDTGDYGMDTSCMTGNLWVSGFPLPSALFLCAPSAFFYSDRLFVVGFFSVQGPL